MMTKFFTVAIFIFITTFSLQAQEDTEEKLSLTTGSIENQFEYIFQKSNNYQDYKVVKKNWLYVLRNNTLDSVKRVENALLVAKNLTSEQDKKINELNAQLAESNNNLANVTEEKDSISFFGALINKPAYKGIMWGIIVVLVLILGLFVYRFKNANIITQEAKKSLAELEM